MIGESAKNIINNNKSQRIFFSEQYKDCWSYQLSLKPSQQANLNAEDVVMTMRSAHSIRCIGIMS